MSKKNTNKQLKIKCHGLKISENSHIEPFKYDENAIGEFLNKKHTESAEYFEDEDTNIEKNAAFTHRL